MGCYAFGLAILKSPWPGRACRTLPVGLEDEAGRTPRPVIDPRPPGTRDREIISDLFPGISDLLAGLSYLVQYGWIINC
jgi:hypothetical protein